jgi:hypothetical protein
MTQQFNLQSQKSMLGTKLGELLKEYSKWIRINIFFFWLIIPLFILFFKYIQLLIAINELKSIEQNPHLDQAFMMFLVGLILDVTGVGAPFSAILMMLGFEALESWMVELNERTPSPHLQLASEGFHTAKIGSILILLIVGFFMLPGGCDKAGDGLIQYFGGSQPSIGSTQGYSQPPPTINPPIYDSTEHTPQSPVDSKKSRFCSHCGAELPSSHVKFCENCGSETD